jgi:RecA-family ATPase
MTNERSAKRNLLAAATAPTWQEMPDGKAVSVGRSLPVVDYANWEGTPPDRQSYWGALLPFLQTTMLTGPGGVGKSLLGQQLSAAIALGLPFLGLDTVRAKCIYITCEDDADELWRRQDAINAALGVGMGSLAGNLFLSSLCGQDGTALADFTSGTLQVTERWQQLAEFVRSNGVRVFVYDNATDAMAGDLNDVHQVAEFVNMLTGLALEVGGAAVILHHPNKAGADWLGSMAWHNKVRSRLMMAHGESAADPDVRTLSNPKANYGPSGGSIAFRWYAGAFVTDDQVPDDYRQRLQETAAATFDNGVFLDCLRQRLKEQRAVSASPSATYAPSEFAEMRESRGIGRERLKLAMNRLFAIGKIESGELPLLRTDRHRAKGLRETAGDAAGDARQTVVGDAGDGIPIKLVDLGITERNDAGGVG